MKLHEADSQVSGSTGQSDVEFDAADALELGAAANGYSQKRVGDTRSASSRPAGRGSGTVVAVAGAKGGVGRTVLAVNLAVALEAAGAWTVLVDLDIEYGDVALALDIVPEFTLADVPAIIDKLEPALLGQSLTKHASGIRVLAAPLRPGQRGRFTADHVSRLLSVLKEMFDFVVVDLPRGLDDLTMAVLGAAHRTVLVTDAQLASVKNSRLALSTLRSREFDLEGLQVVLNNPVAAGQTVRSEVEAGLARDVTVVLPHEKQVARAWLEGKTIFDAKPGSRLASEIRKMASRMLPEEAPGRRRNGLLSWIRRAAPPARALDHSIPGQKAIDSNG